MHGHNVPKSTGNQQMREKTGYKEREKQRFGDERQKKKKRYVGLWKQKKYKYNNKTRLTTNQNEK